MINTKAVAENIQNPKLKKLIEPQPIKAWADAAAQFVKVPLDGDQHQPRFVPPIDLITGVATEQKAKEFVAVWRVIKHTWLWELNFRVSPPPFASRRAWKSFAAGSFSTSEVQPTNQTSIARINFAEFLGFSKVLSLDRESYAFLKEEVPGPVDKAISLEMVREAVCELNNLNFFLDMFEIEYLRTYDPPADIERRMQLILRPGSLSNPLPISHSNLAERAAWLVATRNFMQDWQGPKPPAFNVSIPSPVHPNEIVEFESAIANLYCHNVTYILRRRPNLPKYLYSS